MKTPRSPHHAARAIMTMSRAEADRQLKVRGAQTRKGPTVR